MGGISGGRMRIKPIVWRGRWGGQWWTTIIMGTIVKRDNSGRRGIE